MVIKKGTIRIIANKFKTIIIIVQMKKKMGKENFMRNETATSYFNYMRLR